LIGKVAFFLVKVVKSGFRTQIGNQIFFRIFHSQSQNNQFRKISQKSILTLMARFLIFPRIEKSSGTRPMMKNLPKYFMPMLTYHRIGGLEIFPA